MARPGSGGGTTAQAEAEVFGVSREVVSSAEVESGTVAFTIGLEALTSGGEATGDVGVAAGWRALSGVHTGPMWGKIGAQLDPGVALVGSTLTFTEASGFTGTTFSFDLTAFDDAAVEGTEALTLELTNETNSNGTAALGPATARTDITEIDGDLVFSFRSTPRISEENEAPEPCIIT